MVIRRLRAALVVSLLVLGGAGSADAATAAVFRIFLTDGSMVTAYGEYARVADEVVFSMPVGGTHDEPHLQLVTLPSVSVDWPRTERYATTVRASHYASTRGEEDFARLSGEVARVLNEIAISTDRSRALALAQRARDVLADWPATHYGYRADDTRDILSIIEGAIADLQGVPARRFDIALFASSADVPAEPLLGMPTLREQFQQTLHVASLVTRPTDRVLLMQAALALLTRAPQAFPAADAAANRASLEGQLRYQAEIDAQYGRVSTQLVTAGRRAAEAARPEEVEQLLTRLAGEDARLGGQRPDVVEAMRTELQVHLDAARHLRLARDHWRLRRDAYQEYQRRVGADLLQLVRARPLLEAIRKVSGPDPALLASLRARLSGGAERLQRIPVPGEVQPAHDLLIGAWRFAESAAASRYAAISSGNMATAWTASSAAAGALMLLARTQEEIRALLALPQLQ